MMFVLSLLSRKKRYWVLKTKKQPNAGAKWAN